MRPMEREEWRQKRQKEQKGTEKSFSLFLSFLFPLATCCQRVFPGSFLFEKSLAFLDRQQVVGAHVRYLVNHPARPADFNEVYFRPLLQAEMQPQVALRHITPAAPHFVNLSQITGDDFNPRPDAITIALHADEPDNNKIVRITAVVSQQLWRAVQVVDYQVNIAVIIQVREGDSPTRPLLHQWFSELRGDFRKSPIAVVAMQQLALAVMLQLGVDVPVGDE